MRILIAVEDPTRRHAMATLLADNFSPAIAIEARDVPSALEALVTRHPDFVFAELGLSGHTQGGFRLILDAASLGVPAVVTSGPIAKALEKRIAELGIGWVPKGASEQTLLSVIERAVDSKRRVRPEHRQVLPDFSGPRMHTA